MKRVTKITLLFNFLVLTMACQKGTTVCDFNIEIRDFDGSNGYWVTYNVSKDSLHIHYNCDFENCKDTLLYSTKLQEENADRIFSFLKNKRLDTLKREYINEGFDGLSLDIKISGDSLYDKRISIRRFHHFLIEDLLNEIDESIEVEKLRYHQ
jgi:site-specific recombinase XerD